MSRLDVFINRMVSQRACLNHAAAATKGLRGPVFELGLGNGRTFHHMREIMAERDIFVFERDPTAQPDSTPSEDRLILGDVRKTLVDALTRFGPTATVVHADLGGQDLRKNDVFAKEISPLVEPLLAKGGFMVSSDRMYFSELEELPLPPDAIPGRCFLYGHRT